MLAGNICIVCGRILGQSNLDGKCKVCYDDDKEDLKRLKEYVMNHSNVTILDLANTFNLPPSKVLRLTKEGYFTLNYNSSKSM